MKPLSQPSQQPASSGGTEETVAGAQRPEDLVYERAPLAYLNFDPQGRILDFNATAARLLEASRGKDRLRPLADFVNPRHRQRILGHIRRSQGARSPVTARLLLRAGVEVDVTTKPAAEAQPYRTLMLPVPAPGQSAVPVIWPGDDAKFRALVENSNEVICIGAPDGTIFYTTPAVQRVLGYEQAWWIGRNAFEVMPPDQARLAGVAIRELAKTPTGTVVRMVAQVRHVDGSWKWLEAVLTNLIGQPAIGGIVCNYRDITDSFRTDEALRASEQRYRLLSESLPQMICVRDETGKVLFCNSHWCEYRGTTREEAPKVAWTSGIPAEDIASLTPPPWVTGSASSWEGECRIRRSGDGEYRWHVVRIMPLPPETGSRARWIAIASDIHERKQAEQEREKLLHQLEGERTEVAVQTAVVGVLAESATRADAAPRLLETFCEHLGWQAGALWTIGADHSERRMLTLTHLHQQRGLPRATRLQKNGFAPLRKGQGLAGRAWEQKKPLAAASRLSPDRGVAHYRAVAGLGMRSALAFPILLAGEVHGVVELFRPETAPVGDRMLNIVRSVGIQMGLFIERTQALQRLRQSEEALIGANNALERRVRERTAELHEANHELSAEIVERTRLEREIIRISEREQRRIGQDLHDGVCQELAAIAFMTRALSTRVIKSGAAEPERINEVAHLLNDSISRCRDIARGLHPVEMDADGLMVALKDLAERSGQTIACTFACKQPILMPESDMALNLYRIAQEAVNNAVKYSHATHIIISLERDDGAVRLCIADDGRGIPPKPGSRRSHKRGGGMGLHIMRYRARTMGATLRVNARHPHGTEVVCTLPHS